MNNEAVSLTDEQWRVYRDWVEKQAADFWEADAAESLEISLTFTFCPLGRRVQARLGSSTLLIEDV